MTNKHQNVLYWWYLRRERWMISIDIGVCVCVIWSLLNGADFSGELFFFLSGSSINLCAWVFICLGVCCFCFLIWLLIFVLLVLFLCSFVFAWPTFFRLSPDIWNLLNRLFHPHCCWFQILCFVHNNIYMHHPQITHLLFDERTTFAATSFNAISTAYYIILCYHIVFFSFFTL